VTDEAGKGENLRVEALLEANAELAAELRSVSLSRASAPRSSASPAARRLAKLLGERDSLAAEREALSSQLDQARAELAAAQQAIERLNEHIRDLGRSIEEQRRELQRLRSGFAGWLRRARAGLRRRQG
jgi:predicted  nucleic acid-binding Zn-ribbon protein